MKKSMSYVIIKPTEKPPEPKSETEPEMKKIVKRLEEMFGW